MAVTIRPFEKDGKIGYLGYRYGAQVGESETGYDTWELALNAAGSQFAPEPVFGEVNKPDFENFMELEAEIRQAKEAQRLRDAAAAAEAAKQTPVEPQGGEGSGKAK